LRASSSRAPTRLFRRRKGSAWTRANYPETRELAAEFGFTLYLRTRGEEAKALREEAGFCAHRWVVERAYSWLNRFRRLLIRWEKKPANYLAMLHLACALQAR
jgi:putative transposase